MAYYFKKNLGKFATELQTHWLRRIRATRPQTELTLAERLVNMDDAFETSLAVQNHQILLLDDVMTTGSTLNAAARCLKEAGASSVGAIVLSRKCGTHLKMDFLIPETQKIRTDPSSKMVYRDLQLLLVFQQIF